MKRVILLAALATLLAGVGCDAPADELEGRAPQASENSSTTRSDAGARKTDGAAAARVTADAPDDDDAGAPPSDDPTTKPPTSAVDLAAALLAKWGKGLTGNDVVRQDLTAASKDQTITNRDTCNKTIKIDPKLLGALLKLTEKYDLFVDNIVTGHGCDQYFHPKGMASDLGSATDHVTGASTNFTPGTSRDDKALDRDFVVYFASILPDNAGLGQSECAGRVGAPVRKGVHFFDDTCTHQHVQMTY